MTLIDFHEKLSKLKLAEIARVGESLKLTLKRVPEFIFKLLTSLVKRKNETAVTILVNS